jgi:hypothetical protein
MPAEMMLPRRVLDSEGGAGKSDTCHGQENGGHEFEFNAASHEVVSNTLAILPRVAVILSHAVKRANANPAAWQLLTYPKATSRAVTADVLPPMTGSRDRIVQLLLPQAMGHFKVDSAPVYVRGQSRLR